MALWNGALEELEKLRFIKNLGNKGSIYTVTHEGFEWVEKFSAQLPLEIDLNFDGEPPKQRLLVRANKKVTLTQIAYMFSNEVTVASEDLKIEGDEFTVPVNESKLLTLWNAPRPDKASWDHAGPAKLGVAISCNGRKRELILPVLLESIMLNNTMHRKIIGKKSFSSLN